MTCAQWLWKKIIALYEQAAECDGEVVRPKEPNWTAWANEIRLMCVQDGRTHKQICEMYSRVSRDPFWCRNVLSPSKLRENGMSFPCAYRRPSARTQKTRRPVLQSQLRQCGLQPDPGRIQG